MVKVNVLTLRASPHWLKQTLVAVARPTNTPLTDFETIAGLGGVKRLLKEAVLPPTGTNDVLDTLHALPRNALRVN